jgi:L-threonylcarbamoyladenylate synthase
VRTHFAFSAALGKTSQVKTELTRSPEIAASHIREGGIVAFPTETVYGLGADIFNDRAISKIFEAKRRPADNPLIAHVGAIEQITDLAAEVPETARRFIERFFPGPLTVVLRKSESVPLIATAGLDTIGVRMPGNPTANEFLRACGAPVVAPSANLSGRPSPTTWQAVQEDLDGRIDCILQGDPTEIGLESTVVDCTVDPPIVLRAGAVTVEALQECVDGTILIGQGEIEEARSPGMRHRHYSPSAHVVLSEDWRPDACDSTTAFIGLNQPDWSPDLFYLAASVDEYASKVFEFFRECDRRGIERIVCQPVGESGIGIALMDRLRRAAER